MSAYIIDTETTGEEPVGEVIELAVGVPTADLGVLAGFMVAGERFKPTGRINFKAMAVHHILPHELEGCPPASEAKNLIPADMEYMIGHNVDYDWEHLGRPACKRICTLAISRYIWPGNDGHNLGALTYHLSTDLVMARELLKQSHGAVVDVELTYAVLRAQLENEIVATYLKHAGGNGWGVVEALWQFSENARIPRIWTFGKHKGQDIDKTDRGYLSWCLRQPDMDEYVKTACRMALAGELK